MRGPCACPGGSAILLGSKLSAWSPVCQVDRANAQPLFARLKRYMSLTIVHDLHQGGRRSDCPQIVRVKCCNPVQKPGLLARVGNRVPLVAIPLYGEGTTRAATDGPHIIARHCGNAMQVVIASRWIGTGDHTPHGAGPVLDQRVCDISWRCPIQPYRPDIVRSNPCY